MESSNAETSTIRQSRHSAWYLRPLPGQKKAVSGIPDQVGGITEVGGNEQARQLITRNAEPIRKRGKILVIGHEDCFSSLLMDFATNMAKRMKRDVVALNVGSSDLGFEFFSAHQRRVREDFEHHAVECAKIFRKKAEERGIAFEHVVKFGNPNRTMQVICQRSNQMMYVLLEPEPADHRRHGHKTDPAIRRPNVPIFCMFPTEIDYMAQAAS